MIRIAVVLSVFLLSAGWLGAQDFDPRIAFKDLRVLRGVWFMPTDRGDRLEIWQIEDDSTMTGRSLRIKPENGDTVLLETMRLTIRDTNVVYSAVVRGQNNNKAVDFLLTEAYSDEFLFENPAHDDPQKIRYLMLGNREIQVTTEGKKNGRTITREYVFEREFKAAGAEFRVRAGTNISTIATERAFNNMLSGPDFGVLPGWELGLGILFKGSGGFLNINTEIGLAGRYFGVNSRFFSDTTEYVRDGTYLTNWFTAALYPEFTLKRDGRLTLLVGPYYSRLISSRLNGTTIPRPSDKLFNTNKDLNKNDLGILAGVHYQLKPKKKDMGAKLGARFNIGMRDLDNLYKRRCSNPALCNERLLLRSISLYYSINLVQL
jgi:hypothetical protein